MARASAGTGNGVSGNDDYEAYSLGGQIVHSSGFAASVNWVHFASTFRADKAIDSITGDLSYYGGPYVISLGYAYTTAEKGNKLEVLLHRRRRPAGQPQRRTVVPLQLRPGSRQLHRAGL